MVLHGALVGALSSTTVAPWSKGVTKSRSNAVTKIWGHLYMVDYGRLMVLQIGLEASMERGSKRQYCMKGLHEMNKANTYIRAKTGKRRCRECMRDRRKLERPTGKVFLNRLSVIVGRARAVRFATKAALKNLQPETELFEWLDMYPAGNISPHFLKSHQKSDRKSHSHSR